MFRRAITTTVLCTLMLLSTTATLTHAQSNVCAPPAIGDPITLEGDSLTTTAPFTLTTGTYTLDWSAPTNISKHVSMHLVSTTDTAAFGKLLVNTTTADTGVAYAYNVKAGTYYLKTMTPGHWTATLTPVAV